MNLFGKEYSKAEVLKRIGDISQLGGIKSYKFTDGMREGVRAIDIKTPNGFDLTVLLSRCMDISYLSYKSIPISWRSAVKETSPYFHDKRDREWLNSFFGGFLQTNGLDNIGEPSEDIDAKLPMQGRISNLSAENVYVDGEWQEDDYFMWVKGKVRQVQVAGDKFELSRKISIKMNEKKVFVEDIIENIGNNKSSIMILYHINIGFPIIDEGSQLIGLFEKTIPIGDSSKEGLENFNLFTKPNPYFRNQVYIHKLMENKDGICTVAVINENFNNGEGFGIKLSYNKENLPYLVQWKSMIPGEYVCGIEPANCGISGKKIEKEKGNLRYIEPGEKINFNLEFEILDLKEKIILFKKRMKKDN